LYPAAHSDAKHLLFQQGGVEPAAALLLQEVLDRASLSLEPQLAPPPQCGLAQAARDGAQPSFLTTLLGSQLQQTALATIQRHG